MEALTRIGFAARGILYLLIAVLLLRSGRAEDGAGALETLAGGSGRLLLAAMAIGFAAYGVWRLADATLDAEGRGTDAKALAVRAGCAFSGLAHLGLAGLAAMLAAGERGGSSGGSGAEEGAATALSLPGGQVAVAIVAAILAIVGALQFVKVARGSFLKRLDGKAAGRAWILWTGRAGYAARGIVFLVMGWFFLRAARNDDASDAGGMGEALASLPETLQTGVGAGLLLFGLFSLVEARHRRIAHPHVLRRIGNAVGS
jgi:hypothetical protein